MTQIARAVAALKDGGIVAIPTETVYGLAVDATNPAAIQRLFDLKNRPDDRPLTLQVATVDQIWAHGEKTSNAEKLAAAYMPGPLTLILKKENSSKISGLINQNGPTLGFRIPSHTVALALLGEYGQPLAVPSANFFGQAPATTPQEVRAHFGESVDVYLEGGGCLIGNPSTVVDLTHDEPGLLREGAIAYHEILNTLGR